MSKQESKALLAEFPKEYIKSITPVIEHLNKECLHRYYQYLLAIDDPDDNIIEPESCFEDSRIWRQAHWGFDQLLVANDDDSIANALSQNEIRLYDGQIIDNPFIVTTNLVKIICMEYKVDYDKFEQYRNKHNQIFAKYGPFSKEFRSISWDSESESPDPFRPKK